MAKYTQSDSEIFKGLIVIFLSTLALPLLIIIAVSVVAGFYLAGIDPTWLYPLVGGVVGILISFIVIFLRSYDAQKKFRDRGQTELSITDKTIVFRIGDTRSEIPYDIVKKAYFLFGFLLIKIIGGGMIGIPVNKLSAKEQKKLVEKLGLSTQN